MILLTLDRRISTWRGMGQRQPHLEFSSFAWSTFFLSSALLYRSLSPISFFHDSISGWGNPDVCGVFSFRNT